MKKFIALTVLATSVASFAASNSAINDLQYLPDQGTLFGATTLNYLKYSDTSFDGDGMARSSNDGPIFQQHFGYAVRDNFSLEARFMYTDTESEFSGDEPTRNKGFGDINLFGRYRLTDSTNRFDILGNLSISPGDSEYESDGDSNAYSGGHSISVGPEYGGKYDNYQWAVTALYVYDFESTTKDEDNDETYKDEAHSGLNFAAQLLTKLTEDSYIRNFAGVNFTEEYEDDDDNVTTGNTQYLLGGEYQHILTKDVFVKGGFTAIIPGNGYSRVLMLYHVGANYQF